MINFTAIYGLRVIPQQSFLMNIHVTLTSKIKKSRRLTGFFNVADISNFMIIPAVHALERPNIIKAYTHFFHDFMRRFRGQLTYIKGFFDHKMMDRMS